VIPVNKAHLFIAASTHPGMKGKNNEDRYAVSAHVLDKEGNIPSLLAVICDGIGGHRAGEVAAEMAVETISRTVADSDGQQPADVLTRAIANANQAIHAQASSDPAQRGMGATCVIAWVIGYRLYTASLGDSRLFFARGDTILQVTTDHTWIQEAIDFGALTPQQAVGHPNAHVIRRYLGAQSPMTPDFRLRLQPDETDVQSEANQGLRLLPGDRLVLCSDGLTDLVTKEEILGAICSHERKAALDYLINLANSRGGHDNITAIYLEVPPDEDLTQPLRTMVHTGKEHPNQRLRSCLGILLLIALLALLGVLLYKYLGVVTKPRVTPTSSPTAARRVTPVIPGVFHISPTVTGKLAASPTFNRVPPNPPSSNTPTLQLTPTPQPP
jgi:serine/threonine protein phosphatase PrpC